MASAILGPSLLSLISIIFLNIPVLPIKGVSTSLILKPDITSLPAIVVVIRG